MAQDFGFLHFDLLLFLHLLHLHRFGDDCLLLDVGLNLIGLIRLRLLFLNQLGVRSFLHLEIALGLCLLGL